MGDNGIRSYRTIKPNTHLGHATVLSLKPIKTNKYGRTISKYECICDCGKKFTRCKDHLDKVKYQKNLSCGCQNKGNNFGKRYNTSPIIPKGTKIGNLIVIKLERKQGKRNGQERYQYLCQCVCGKPTTKIKEYLDKKIKNNDNTGCSCGCISLNKINIGPLHPLWQGQGLISQHVFKTIIENAKKRSLEFDITIEYIWNLYLKQDKKCAISGLPIEFASCSKSKSKFQTASLDRIDSSKGYVKNNVQWVHKTVNKIKQDLMQIEFVNLCYLIARNQKLTH
jgi:hypothetical protein